MMIKVTYADIINGLRVSCHDCAIARAIKRQTGCDYVSVTREWIEVGSLMDFKKICTPMVAVRFMNNSDCNEKVKPFEFDLNL